MNKSQGERTQPWGTPGQEATHLDYSCGEIQWEKMGQTSISLTDLIVLNKESKCLISKKQNSIAKSCPRVSTQSAVVHMPVPLMAL